VKGEGLRKKNMMKKNTRAYTLTEGQEKESMGFNSKTERCDRYWLNAASFMDYGTNERLLATPRKVV